MNDIIARQKIRRRRCTPKKHTPPRQKFAIRRRSRVLGRGVSTYVVRLVQGLRGIPLLTVRTAGALLLILLAALVSILLYTQWGTAAEGFPVEEDGMQRKALAAYAGLAPTPVIPSPGSVSIPLNLAESFAWELYTVEEGDTISAIASARSLSMDAVIASNGISNAKRIRQGMELRLPNMDGIPYTVRRGDSLLGISRAWGVPMEAILDANDLQSATIRAGTTLFLPGARMGRQELRRVLGDLFIYPLRGRITSGYGWRNDPFTGVRRFHAAIDMAAPIGTPIRASMDGRVSALGTNSVYGKFIILSHEGGFQTLYAHLDSFSVAKNARVTQGDSIGRVGNTGYSTGAHLHFAIFKHGRARNPLEFLGR